MDTLGDVICTIGAVVFKKKNKLMRNNSEQLNRSGHEQFKSSIGQRDKCVWGGNSIYQWN